MVHQIHQTLKELKENSLEGGAIGREVGNKSQRTNRKQREKRMERLAGTETMMKSEEIYLKLTHEWKMMSEYGASNPAQMIKEITQL